jgi:hypothetical protein
VLVDLLLIPLSLLLVCFFLPFFLLLCILCLLCILFFFFFLFILFSSFFPFSFSFFFLMCFKIAGPYITSVGGTQLYSKTDSTCFNVSFQAFALFDLIIVSLFFFFCAYLTRFCKNRVAKFVGIQFFKHLRKIQS